MNRFILLPLLSGWMAWAQVDVLTANYDNDRTNANLAESVLSPATVLPGSFGKLTALSVQGQIYAQPLVVSNLQIPACGTCNVLYVATMQNFVYAFNASTLNPTPLWSVNLGPPVPAASVGLGAVNPVIGILSTPVIDRARGAIYVVAESLRASGPAFQLHALDLTTGVEILGGPADIAATVNGSGQASDDNGVIALDPGQQIQRPGLLAASGGIYIGFGSIFDRAPYHGWMLAYETGYVRNQLAVFNSTPDGALGGIWQSGRGPVSDGAGSIYFGTGNGDYDGITNFGESFLRTNASLQIVDWFTPSDWQDLSDVDLDTASLGPMLIPSINMLFAGDKANNGYLIDRFNMTHLGLSNASIPQTMQPITDGGLFNAAVWDRSDGPIVYCVDEGVSTSAWRIVGRQFEPQPLSITSVTSDYPWQGIAISASGSQDGTGILWMTTGDHNSPAVPGTLYAFNAQDLTQLLWSSEMNPSRDRLGQFAKFTPPTVANGLVFVPTFSNRLVVYGLMSTSTRVAERSHPR